MNNPGNPFQVFSDIQRGAKEGAILREPSQYLTNQTGQPVNLNPLDQSWTWGSDKAKDTEADKKQREQVANKMAAGFSAHSGNAAADAQYLRSLYDAIHGRL
jgi:hypothetical protein